MKNFEDIFKDTPAVNLKWKNMQNNQKMDLINNTIKNHNYDNKVVLVNCEDDGYIYFNFTEHIPANIRGELLMDIELILKKQIDSGLTVWLSPQGDKSSLRRLRGVEVKVI
jgi:hypothetical protein